jgi:DNA-binding CsgD family transcriptional regulator
VVCDRGRFIMKDVVLTRRQVEVLSWVKKDLSDNESASRLFMSTNTYKRHMQNMRLLLGFRSSKSLAVFATKHRI